MVDAYTHIMELSGGGARAGLLAEGLLQTVSDVYDRPRNYRVAWLESRTDSAYHSADHDERASRIQARQAAAIRRARLAFQ